MNLRPKDYIQTADDLFFAVVSDVIDDDRVATTLRYYCDKGGRYHKLQGEVADTFLKRTHKNYLYHSQFLDVQVHAVPLADINQIWRPEQGIKQLLQVKEHDLKQRDACHCVMLLLGSGVPQEQLGITGSLLIGTYNDQSDIDLVVYGRNHFFKIREQVKTLIEQGKFSQLDNDDWQSAYKRRDCSLSFDEYFSHEQRKFNKFICGFTKVDISLIPLKEECVEDKGPFRKHDFITLYATVTDDLYSFDYPARYFIDHETIPEIVSYTATYTGQAFTGDKIEAAGYIEEDTMGKKRLMVGTSREAENEYIRLQK